jgi:hypothetical protein
MWRLCSIHLPQERKCLCIADRLGGRAESCWHSGCGNATDVMGCLRAANSTILQASGTAAGSARIRTLFPWSPILDEYYIRERAVNAFKKGHFAKVPVFFGCVLLTQFLNFGD